jgi:hypothetical protein
MIRFINPRTIVVDESTMIFKRGVEDFMFGFQCSNGKIERRLNIRKHATLQKIKPTCLQTLERGARTRLRAEEGKQTPSTGPLPHLRA